MDIIQGYEGLSPGQRGAAVALGNFDGVHLGHRAVIEAARASEPDAPLGVVTFDPHPRRFFQPDAPAFELTSLAEKARKLQGIGVERLYVLRFDAALSSMTPDQFAADVLANGLGVCSVATGSDFRFGAKRAGDVETLRTLGEKHGFTVSALKGVSDEDGDTYSSSAAREALRDGRPEDAAAILGEPHRIVGVVQKGDQRGRTIGFPTANLPLEGTLAPKFGVYAVTVDFPQTVNSAMFNGAANIGIRPNYRLEKPNLEVNLFDFDGDLYGEEIRVALHHYIRPEAEFDGPEALTAQIAADCGEARRLLGHG